MNRIVVVTPTYNEAGNIPPLVEKLFGLNIPGLDVLVVDDNSPDGTGQVVLDLRARYADRLHLLHRETKEGLRAAYIHGFKHALGMGADIIVQMDADGSHQPKYIPAMLDRLQMADVVIGSRWVRGGSVDASWGWWRKALSGWANRIYTPMILGMPVKDATGGFRAWRRDTLVGMGLDRIHASGYVFLIEMIYVAHKLGYAVAEVPIHFPDRQIGESKMSSSIMFEAALRVWEIRNHYRRLNPSQRAAQPEQA